MESLKLQKLGLQAWFGIAILSIILVAGPTHSHVVRRDAENKVCEDDWLYFEETEKCYPDHKKGPCGELMVLGPSDADVKIGECICEYDRDGLTCPQRPKVYWKQESRCYNIYSQGPCKKGEWVVPHRDDVPSCEKISCLKRYNAQLQKKNYYEGSTQYIFPHAGKCYEANNKEDHYNCPGEQVFFVMINSYSPHCTQDIPCVRSQEDEPEDDNNFCPDNSAPDFQGGCEPTTDVSSEED